MSKKISKLEALVQLGVIRSYTVRTLDMDNVIVDNPGDGSRESDELEMVFPNGEVLIIQAFCSGSAENAVLLFAEQMP